jgi:Fic family protein
MSEREPIWKHPDFPKYYYNEKVVCDLDNYFRNELRSINSFMTGKPFSEGLGEILAEETVKSSQIEGVDLDRDSIRSSFLNNLPIKGSQEKGAVAVSALARDHSGEPLTHDLLKEMHRRLFEGTGMPEDQRGVYVGDMRLVSGGRVDREPTVEDEGVPAEQVDEAMGEFVDWFNAESTQGPLSRLIQGHHHFESIHPFADGNGRIGRALIQMSLRRGPFSEAYLPLALSRAIQQNPRPYYDQFRSGLDLTETIKKMAPVLTLAARETVAMIEVTRLRGLIKDDDLNVRQRKVMERLIDYELAGKSFEGGLSNQNYRKMAGVEGRTAQRDLSDLVERGILIRMGQLKGTRYWLKIWKNQKQIIAGLTRSDLNHLSLGQEEMFREMAQADLNNREKRGHHPFFDQDARTLLSFYESSGTSQDP